MSVVSAVALLKEDEQLAAAIPPSDRERAERLIVVAGFTAEVGPLEVPADNVDPSLGLLVLDGLVTVNVVLGDRVASQLAGPGDVIDLTDSSETVLPASLTYLVSDTSRIAILDRRFIAAVRRWPGLLLALHERLRDQERRLAIHSAIGKLRRIEDRVLALLWHLGERWGRVSPEGVVVPLSLTHETIGRLAGAERPTVSLALTELARTGDVVKREDGAFVLAYGSVDRLRPEVAAPHQLRPLSVTVAGASGAGNAGHAAILGRDATQRRLAALHAERLDAVAMSSRTRG